MANGILLACMHAYMVVPHHGYRLLTVHKFRYLFGRMCTCMCVSIVTDFSIFPAPSIIYLKQHIKCIHGKIFIKIFGKVCNKFLKSTEYCRRIAAELF